jgi:signal transduction histidine kinase
MDNADELRRRAEKEVQMAKEKGHIPKSVVDLIHELYMHQVELEMQNKELKQSQYDINKALEQADSIVNTVREPLVVLDDNIRVISANSSFYETFKVNPLETEGKLVYDLGNRQWDIPKLRQLLEDILPSSSSSSSSVLEDFEITHFFPAIGKKTMLLNARQIRIPIQKSMILLAIEDITKRKQMEEKLKHVHENLEERVDEQTVELKDIIDELKRSNAELEQFAYVASHDLQEPLRTIASFTQLLERRYKGKFDEDADEFMDFVINAAIQMKAQIEGLLEYSRIARYGKEFKHVNTDDILNKTINNLNTSIRESNAEIISDKLPTVTGDEIQLQRVFQNIISNAIRFRKCEEPLKIHISARADKENNEYVFSVEDNGIGIEEQYVERIFVIFQRLHTREMYKGTGIGLSIVKKVIDRHGGRVWVESKLGKGSTFYFTIPFKPSEIGGGAFLKKRLK